jgi:hypothetical protein
MTIVESLDATMKSLEQLSLAWQRVAENKISLAQQEGLFDNLTGFGRPLEEIMDLSDPHGWIRRAIRDINAVPPATRSLIGSRENTP